MLMPNLRSVTRCLHSQITADLQAHNTSHNVIGQLFSASDALARRTTNWAYKTTFSKQDETNIFFTTAKSTLVKDRRYNQGQQP
jgi:hypothetical protein